VVRNLLRKAQKHLAANGMSYRSHFAFAFGHSLRCFKAALFLATHAVAPCFFRRAGSRLVARMSKDFTEHRIACNAKSAAKRD